MGRAAAFVVTRLVHIVGVSCSAGATRAGGARGREGLAGRRAHACL